MLGLIKRYQRRRLGRERLKQFQRVVKINDALEGEDWLTLTDLLNIDYELISTMTLEDWQQAVIVRLHDFAAEIGVDYTWSADQKGK